MESRKLTMETAIEMEMQGLADAIGNALELNDEFVSRYCGENVAAQLRRIPESDREFILQSHIGDGREVGGFYSMGADTIALPVGEIEVQFEGAPEDEFEDPSEWTISGNLAYCLCDGVEFPIDVASLTEEIDEHLSGDCPEEFIEAYLECALWASTDDDGNPLDDEFDVDDIDRETRKTIRADCLGFWRRNGWMMAADPGRAGHDFWLTRNGHGAGFWDGRWPEDIGARLTSAAKVYGSFDLYMGDDRRIHGQ